jgi:hypothetical protein
MELLDLVRAILKGDLLKARQWVADAYREPVDWARVEQPIALNDLEMCVAAALVELLASRRGSSPPSWTTKVGVLKEQLILDPGLEQMPRSFAHAKRYGPEPFRRRNLVVLPDF